MALAIGLMFCLVRVLSSWYRRRSESDKFSAMGRYGEGVDRSGQVFLLRLLWPERLR